MLLCFKFDDIGNGPPLYYLLQSQAPPIQCHTCCRLIVVAVDIIIVAATEFSSILLVIIAAPTKRFMVLTVDLNVPSPLRSNQLKLLLLRVRW